MYLRILKKLLDCIRHNQYVVSVHAVEELEEDDLSIFDLERAVLNGDIVERQKDKKSGEWKYVVRGNAIDGRQVVVITKFGPTGKAIIITVFEDE